MLVAKIVANGKMIKSNTMKTFNRYKQNLKLIGNDVISYNTHVAEIKDNKLYRLKWYVAGVGASSITTTKHINYVANELNLEII